MNSGGLGTPPKPFPAEKPLVRRVRKSSRLTGCPESSNWIRSSAACQRRGEGVGAEPLRKWGDSRHPAWEKKPGKEFAQPPPRFRLFTWSGPVSMVRIPSRCRPAGQVEPWPVRDFWRRRGNRFHVTCGSKMPALDYELIAEPTAGRTFPGPKSVSSSMTCHL